MTGSPEYRLSHAPPEENSIRKAGLLSGPIGVCGICLLRIWPGVSRPDGGTGLVFSVSSAAKCIHFGAGRCSWYPQNNATASSLASDKYFTNAILESAGVPTLGGEYFFLHERHRALRAAGHERDAALEYFRKLGGTAFAKPLLDRAAISHKPFMTKPRCFDISMRFRSTTIRY